MLGRIKALWTGEANGVTAAAFIIGGASLASRAIGVVRDRVLASTFGAGDALDTYYAAFRLPDTLYNLLILGALSAGFIPVFAEYIETRGKEAAWKLAAQVVSAVGFALVVGCGILAVAAPWAVPLITPGFSPEKMETTVQLTRIMLLSPLLMGLSGVMGGVLQASRRFFAFSIAPILYNLGIIFGALVLSKPFGIAGVAWGVILGALLHLLVQASVVWPMGMGKLPWPSFRAEGVRRILLMMAPRTAGLAVGQLNLVFLMAFGSYLSKGSVSIMNLANNLYSFPIGIIGVSYAVAAFPLLASSAGLKDKPAFLHHFEGSARKIIFLIIPVTAVFLLLRAQIVRLALGAGAFDWDDTIRTADVLGILALSLPAQALVPLIARAFYATQDSRTPFFAGIASEAVNLAVAALSYKAYGVWGLAAAFSISSWVNALLLYGAWKFTHADRTPRLASTLFKTVLAAALLCAISYPVRQAVGTWYPLRTYWQVALQAAAACAAGGLAFFIVARLLHMPELSELAYFIRRKHAKARMPVAGAEEAQGR